MDTLTLTLTRRVSHDCPLQLHTGDHPAPLQLLRERMATLLQQHACSGCRGAARCAQRGQSPSARSSLVRPAVAPEDLPLARGHPPSGPREESLAARKPKMGCSGATVRTCVNKRGCSGATVRTCVNIAHLRRPHRLWLSRCRLPPAGESGMLQLGCDTCGVAATVV